MSTSELEVLFNKLKRQVCCLPSFCITDPLSGEVLRYNESTNCWENTDQNGITGSISTNQVAYGSGINSIQGSDNFYYDGVVFKVGRPNYKGLIINVGLDTYAIGDIDFYDNGTYFWIDDSNERFKFFVNNNPVLIIENSTKFLLSDGSYCLDPSNRQLLAANSSTSLNWANRYLMDGVSGTPKLAWDTTGVKLPYISPVSDGVTALDSSGYLKQPKALIFVSNDTYQRQIGSETLTANRTYSLQDRSGTIGLTTVNINTQTNNYTLVLTDGIDGLIEMNKASAVTLTIPTNTSVSFPIGTQIVIAQYGAGQVTVSPTGGVTMRSASGKNKLTGQYSLATLVKRGTDEWYLSGDITT